MLKLADGELMDGAYPISYRVFYTDYPDVAVEPSNSFTITVADPCGVASENVLTEPIVADQVYTVTDSQFSYQVPSFTSSIEWCDITYTYTAATAIQSTTAFDSESKELTIGPSDDLSLSG